MMKNICNLIVEVFIGVIVGFACLVIVYTIPVDFAEQNVMSSYKQLLNEGINPNILLEFDATRLDNYTDGLMYNTAIYNGNEGPVLKAANNYQYVFEGKNYFDSLIMYMEGENDFAISSYGRYWHGYLVPLKVLLTFFDINEIRMLNMFFQIILISCVVSYMANKKIRIYIPCFLMTLCFMNFSTLFLSMQFSTNINIAMLSIIFLIKNGKTLRERKKLKNFFCLIGILVAYMDLLTCPMITLCFALIFYVILEIENEDSIIRSIMNIINLSFAWSIGYIGMWSGKWIIASIVTGENIIKEAILQILFRTSESSGESGRLEVFNYYSVVVKNLEVYSNKIYLLLIIFFIVIIVFRLMSNWKICIKSRYSMCNTAVQLLLVSIYPFIWFGVVKNHSYIHYWMTHRNFTITILAISCVLMKITSKKIE